MLSASSTDVLALSKLTSLYLRPCEHADIGRDETMSGHSNNNLEVDLASHMRQVTQILRDASWEVFQHSAVRGDVFNLVVR